LPKASFTIAPPFQGKGRSNLSLLQSLQGTIVNGVAIVAGALAGLLLGRLIPERLNQITVQGIGLAVLLIGLQMAIKSEQVLLMIFSLVLGGITGELLQIEERLTQAGRWLESKMGHSRSNVSRAFVNATLVFVVGAMAITGSLESGLLGNHQVLYAKAALDGVTALVFASTLGMGVLFSALPVVLYQGAIVILARWVAVLMTETVITELSATGGLLIVAIALGMLQVKTLKVGNLLPALLYSVILVSWWG
jgi:uncharacterized membrane protein YqgA involved in biofilm formation